MKNAIRILLFSLCILLLCGMLFLGNVKVLIQVQNLEDHGEKINISNDPSMVLWNKTWGGYDDDSGWSVALDTAGNLYCVGDTASFGAGWWDMAVVKFSPNGARLWNTTWGGSEDETGCGVALDTAGNLYCVGFTFSFGEGESDMAVVKFAPNGTRLWNMTWGGDNIDRGNGVALDTAGNLYCVGYTTSFGLVNADMAVVKFAPNGTRLWNMTWGGDNVDRGNGVALDTAGNLYCVGTTGSFEAGWWDMVVVKFSPNGTQLWNTTWGGSGDDGGDGVALNTAGNLYCVGWTGSFGVGNDDMAVVKFSPNGTRLWNTTWGGSGDDVGGGVALDTTGNLYCVGYTTSFGKGEEDMTVVKFAPNGTRLWNMTWGGYDDDGGAGVALDTAGNLYCVGYTFSFGAGWFDMAVVKFKGAELPDEIPGFGLLSLYLSLIAVLIINIFDRLVKPSRKKSSLLP